MEWNEKKKIVDKAEFYFNNEIIAHVLTIPKGTFKNGRFVSDLQEDTYFWFMEIGEKTAIRLFLSEIYDLEDYRMEGGL